IEASSVSISGGAVKLDVASNGVNFEGKLSANHKSFEGTWSQGGASLPMMFTRQPAGGISRKPTDALFPVEGLWQAALETHGMRLRFQLHVSHDTEGELIGALDNLDQGVSGLPAVKLPQKEREFHFEIPAVGGGRKNPYVPSLIGRKKSCFQMKRLTQHFPERSHCRRPGDPSPE